MSTCLPLPLLDRLWSQAETPKFNLLMNAYHEGDADGGVFKVHVLNKSNDTW